MRLRLPPVYAITDRAASGRRRPRRDRPPPARGRRPVRPAAREGAAGRARSSRRPMRSARWPGRSDARSPSSTTASTSPRLAGLGVHLGEEDLPAGAARAILPDTAPSSASRRTTSRPPGGPSPIRPRTTWPSGRSSRARRKTCGRPSASRRSRGRPPDGPNRSSRSGESRRSVSTPSGTPGRTRRR